MCNTKSTIKIYRTEQTITLQQTTRMLIRIEKYIPTKESSIYILSNIPDKLTKQKHHFGMIAKENQ